jgi:hypothetical protein
MLLQETISCNQAKGETVYVAFLDIKKAFDTVWVKGLLYKLWKAGMSTKVWRLLNEAYTGFECAAFIAGEPGEWFVPERGVHQGAPFSMKLYQVFINDMLSELRSCIYGVWLNDVDATCPSFADDTTVCALHKMGLNTLLEITYNHSNISGNMSSTWKKVL